MIKVVSLIYSEYSSFLDGASFISRGSAVAQHEDRYISISCNMKRLLSNAAFKIRSKVYLIQYSTQCSFINHKFSTITKNDTVSLKPII